MIDLRTGADLTRAELRELVADLAARPDEWPTSSTTIPRRARTSSSEELRPLGVA